jgi:hypothetical protein
MFARQDNISIKNKMKISNPLEALIGDARVISEK